MYLSFGILVMSDGFYAAIVELVWWGDIQLPLGLGLMEVKFLFGLVDWENEELKLGFAKLLDVLIHLIAGGGVLFPVRFWDYCLLPLFTFDWLTVSRPEVLFSNVWFACWKVCNAVDKSKCSCWVKRGWEVSVSCIHALLFLFSMMSFCPTLSLLRSSIGMVIDDFMLILPNYG